MHRLWANTAEISIAMWFIRWNVKYIHQTLLPSQLESSFCSVSLEESRNLYMPTVVDWSIFTTINTRPKPALLSYNFSPNIMLYTHFSLHFTNHITLSSLLIAAHILHSHNLSFQQWQVPRQASHRWPSPYAWSYNKALSSYSLGCFDITASLRGNHIGGHRASGWQNGRTLIEARV